MNRHPDKSARRHHQGSVYLLVIATGIVLTAMGIAGLSLVRAQRAATERADGAQRARLAAQSALEMGVALISADPSGTSWRVTQPASPLFSSMVIGDATCSAKVFSSNGGNLADSDAGWIRIAASANVSGARQSVAAEFVPVAVPLPVLRNAIWSQGVMSLKGTLFADATIGSNTSAIASTASVYAAVRAPSVSGTTYLNTTGTVSAAAMPGTASIDMWAAAATPISYASISGQIMQKIVLSGANNPYGPSVNYGGLYVIDCAGRNIIIQNCRINATLILLNTGSGSNINSTVLMEPYLRSYPTLLVKGPMTISMSSSDLTETGCNINLNPGTAPYRGVSDSDLTDSYPSEIYGLTYVSGDLTIDSNSTFEGVVLAGGTLTASDKVTVRSRPPEVAIAGFSQITGFKLRSSTFNRQVD